MFFTIILLIDFSSARIVRFRPVRWRESEANGLEAQWMATSTQIESSFPCKQLGSNEFRLHIPESRNVFGSVL